jgi:hypothetical protein
MTVTKQCSASGHERDALLEIPKPTGNDPVVQVFPWSEVTAETATGNVALIDLSVVPTTTQFVLDVHPRSNIESPGRIGSVWKVEPPSSVTTKVAFIGVAVVRPWLTAAAGTPAHTPVDRQDSAYRVPALVGRGSIVNEWPPLWVTASTGWPL